MNNAKLIGGIMLIIGTSIGAGMLALPVATGAGGFFPSLLLLIICWLIMMLGALLILEVNLWMPPNSNLISMAGRTLGRPAQAIAWVAYLLLLYALLSAYIAGGAAITHHWLSMLGLVIPNWVASIIFTVVLGFVVYRGIIWVDLVNRGLLSAKFIFCLLLILLLLPFIHINNLLQGHAQRLLGATTVVITSFGFATIVPSLRTYFNSDIKKLRLAIIIGSAVPLVFYIAWSLVVQGILPITGTHSLMAMQQSGNVTSQLSDSLSAMTQNSLIDWSANLFTSICILTSFLGVALCLMDFLADGFNVPKKHHAVKIAFAALLPPTILVIFIPDLFIKALSYAGICCIILLILLPALMAYSGRYVKQIALGYRVKGGKPLLILLILASIAAIALDLF